MPRPWEAVLAVVPQAWQRVKRGRSGFAYVPEKTRVAKEEIRLFISQAAPRLFDGPIAVEMVFLIQRPKSAPKRVVHPVKRPDIDNYVKGVLDAGTGLLWGDDSQIVSLTAVKAFGNPQIKLKVTPLE